MGSDVTLVLTQTGLRGVGGPWHGRAAVGRRAATWGQDIGEDLICELAVKVIPCTHQGDVLCRVCGVVCGYEAGVCVRSQ